MIAPVLAAACLGLVACGGDNASTTKPTTATTKQTAAPPLAAFRSPRKYGYRFARAPIVVLDGGTFELYLRTSKPLPKKPGKYTDASSTVDHVFGGFGLAKATYSGNPLPCYHQELDISRYAKHEPESVKVGQMVTVRLYIAKHKVPLRVRVPLSKPLPPIATDPAQPYLKKLGCPR